MTFLILLFFFRKQLNPCVFVLHVFVCRISRVYIFHFLLLEYMHRLYSAQVFILRRATLLDIGKNSVIDLLVSLITMITNPLYFQNLCLLNNRCDGHLLYRNLSPAIALLSTPIYLHLIFVFPSLHLLLYLLGT